MSKTNGSKSFFKTYGFLIFMLTGIVAGCLVGAFAPNFGKKIEFLGTLFINMMFCVVVPMVFCSNVRCFGVRLTNVGKPLRRPVARRYPAR